MRLNGVRRRMAPLVRAPQLRNLSIEEYREEKRAHAQAVAPAA